MKKFRLFLMTALLCCTTTVFAQNNDANAFAQQALDAHEKKIVYRAQLAKDVVGWRIGAEYSLRRMIAVAGKNATKHGVHFVGGYRFNKRLYLGGIAGIDVTTPFTIVEDGYSNASANYEVDREDKIYGLIMADARLYMNISRVSTYLFANYGIEYSKELTQNILAGLGFDIHTKKSQSVNIGLGVGMGSCHTTDNGIANDFLHEQDHGYGPLDCFVFNLKLGYTF
ncbi:MAG: hypothetical protein J6K33_03350 [Alistipes sp.]|nr:hypothetical protein [Alistipes sp.]